MRHKIISWLTFIVVLFIFYSQKIQSVEAANLTFDPTTYAVGSSQSFQIKINIDTGADKVVGADIYIVYDSNLLEVIDTINGTFFSQMSVNKLTLGKLYLSGTLPSLSLAKAGTGIVATVNFRAKTAGSTVLTYECSSGSTTDTNIIKDDANSTDVVVCASNGTSTISISSGTSPTVTVTMAASPTITTGPTITTTLPRPSATIYNLPRTGVIENTVVISIISIFLIALGAGLIFLI